MTKIERDIFELQIVLGINFAVTLLLVAEVIMLLRRIA